MLQVSGVTKAFGAREVLRDVTFHVPPRDRIGLVAVNGAGKTTLLRIIAGEIAPETGTVAVSKGVVIGYLSQEGTTTAGNTVREELMSRWPGLAALQDIQGYDVDTEIAIVLHGLGFASGDAERPVESFSGGWQMRIGLARLLLQHPDLLLLDEPTNHLDMDAVEWLEEYLKGYPGAILVVSHDRYILDRVTSRTFELSNSRLEEYAASYSGFVVEKARRREQQLAAFERQQAFIERTEIWIDRFHAKATKASQVKSREHMLERLDRVEAPEAQDRQIRLRFDAAGRSGRAVLEARGVTRRFGSLTVLDAVNLVVERGDRIALVGPNGSGKSTLLRVLAGVDAPDEGEVRRGYNVQPAYFAQHQAEALDPTRTALEELGEGSELSEGRLRSLLGRFLFTGDDTFKKVGVLSGGERSRLAFAKMLLRDANLLLLDEPTNHLDIPSQEVLEQALVEYPGAVILASHDRYLIDRIATKVVAVGDGRIELHLGNYTQYRERLLARRRIAENAVKVQAPAPAKDTPARIRQQNAAARKRVGDLEAEIARLEMEIEGLAALLASPELYADYQQAQRTVARHKEASQQLDALLAEWEQAAGAVSSL